MKRHSTRVVVALCCVLLFTGVVAAQADASRGRDARATAGETPALQRLITEKDLFQFTWIGDPQISPDGAQVAFVKVTVNEKKDGYDTAIWTVSTRTNELKMLTAGPGDTSPQWSPDGSRLAFVRSAEKDGKRQPPQIYILPMGGGEAWQLTRLPKGASRPTWSPDGNTLAFNSTTNADDLLKEACKSGKEKDRSKCPPPDVHESDVKVITRAVYRMNGAGYLDYSHPNHIWSIAVPGNPQPALQPKQLTSGDFSEQDIEWAPDGSKIYFLCTRDLEPYYKVSQNSVYSIPAAGGEWTEVAKLTPGSLRSLSVSPDGKQMAALGTMSEPVQSFTQPELWVIDLTRPGSAPRNLTANLDAEVGGGLTGDQAAPRGSGGSKPFWTADGKAIITVVAKQGRANLERFDAATGQATPLTTGDQSVEGYQATPDGSQIVAEISTPTNIHDLFLVAGGETKRLTSINEKLFSQLNLTAPEEIWYPSFDGKKIQAWVQKPPDFDAKKKYPLILNIHGGPHAAYGFVFFHEMQWMAAKGYVVLYSNPRGSTTYGQEFGNIIQYHYPGDDFKDLMAGVDELIRRGYIDEKHMGVTGGSGGGLLTNWVVGHTDRFAAAVSQRDIASWAAWWYAADFTLFQPTWFRKAPFEDPEDFTARSPITYINNVKTPLMLILGDADYRTPPATGGEEVFRALKYRHIPTAMVRFPGESHELSRSGQPWHRIERLHHIVNWFDLYLQGKATHEYDLAPPAP